MENIPDYQLKPQPKEYRRLVGGVLTSGLIVLLSGAALTASFFFSKVSTTFFGSALLIFLCSIGYLLRQKKRIAQFPDSETFHRRVLEPKQHPELLKQGLSIPIAAGLHRLDYYLTLIFAVIGMSMLIGISFAQVFHLSVFIISGLITLTCVWSLWRMPQINRLSEPSAIKAEKDLLRLPISALEFTHAAKLAKANLITKEIPWTDIKEWEVRWGGWDGPDLYQIHLKNGESVSVYRSALRGKEIPLLEYARATGVSVVLKDSVLA